MRILGLILILLVLPWLHMGMSTDPQFGVSWCVTIATGMALWLILHQKRMEPTSGSLLWLSLVGLGVAAVEWRPSLDMWRWVSVAALLLVFPMAGQRRDGAWREMSRSVWSGLMAVVFLLPIILGVTHIQTWIPSLELLFDLHALILVMLVAMRPQMHVLVLVYAGAAWLLDARSAALVAFTALGLQVLQPHLETNGFRVLAGLLTALGVVVLLGAPWAQRNLSYDAAFEQSRANGLNTTMPTPQGGAFIEGSLAERVTQWAWTVPRLEWQGHGARAWQLDAFEELTWLGPPRRKAQRPHNEWLHSMYNWGAWTFVLWVLWLWLAPKTYLIVMPLVFLGFPFERPELVLAMSLLPMVLHEGSISRRGPRIKSSVAAAMGVFIWVLALVRWTQISSSLNVQGAMQRAVRSERLAWPQLSAWERASISRFPRDLQGNDVALFEAMQLANQGESCRALSVLNNRDPDKCRAVPKIHSALEAACN